MEYWSMRFCIVCCGAGRCDIGFAFQIYNYVHCIVTSYLHGECVQIFLHPCYVCYDFYVFEFEVKRSIEGTYSMLIDRL